MSSRDSLASLHRRSSRIKQSEPVEPPVVDSGARRSSRGAAIAAPPRRPHVPPTDDSDDSSDDDAGDDGASGPRYTFRDRSKSRRYVTNAGAEEAPLPAPSFPSPRDRARPQPPRDHRPPAPSRHSDVHHYRRDRKLHNSFPSRRSRRGRSNDSSSGSSQSGYSSSDLDWGTRRRHESERRRLKRELDSIQPLGGGVRDGGANRGDVLRADALPLEIDKSTSMDSVGGLDVHLESLKEMVSLPLMYPEVFQRFGVQAPRGVLFWGPPGTGKVRVRFCVLSSLPLDGISKLGHCWLLLLVNVFRQTLVARALANSCFGQPGAKPVAFFCRKGADILSKFVGEAERQLRLLFEQGNS